MTQITILQFKMIMIVKSASKWRVSCLIVISMGDFNVTQSAFKSRLKNTILLLQNKGDVENWEPTVNFANSL